MEMTLRIEDLEPPYLVIRPGFSEEDFYRLAGEDSDWEYLDGRIVMHSPASNRHEELSGFLHALILFFLGKRGGGCVRGSRYPMRLDPRWSPEPDVMVIRDEHRSAMGTQRLEGPADLTVEIVSESDSHLVYRDKLPRYREAGVAEIWIVDPFRKEVLVDRACPGGRESLVASTGRLDCAVVPGFWIDAAWLWRDELPPPHECLERILGERG
jgi:Uma2 family endonuclease